MDNSMFYIDWHRDAAHVRLTQSEYNEKFQWYKENGVLVDNRKGMGQRTGKQFWYRPWRYCVEQDHQQINLYTSDGDLNLTVYYTMNDNTKCERDLGVSGAAAFRLVDRMFKERHDKSLQVGFGRCEIDFKFSQVNDALAPIIYTNERECDYVQYNIFKADVSSAYPFGLCSDLPDYHKYKELAGVYPPTPEYPFAFYIKSGHMAIYNELDTYKEFRTHPLYCTRGKWRNDLYGAKDVTILCKASRFNLDDIMMELYDKKADDPNIKTMMVAFIGYIRSTKSWQHHYMGHLSACVYARHIKRMLYFYDQIVADGNTIMMIPTDSICWQGHAMPQITVPKQEKRIGDFVSEYENVKLLMLANGVYGIEEKGEIVCFKHQGTSVDEIKVKINKLTDIKKLRNAGVNTFDPESKKFVLVDPIFHIKREV